MSAWEWIIILLLIIIIIAAISYFVWYFWFSTKGAALGQKCDIYKPCDSKLFCSGAGTCEQGKTGVGEGGSCTNSNQCNFSFTCDSKSKTCVTTDP